MRNPGGIRFLYFSFALLWPFIGQAQKNVDLKLIQSLFKAEQNFAIDMSQHSQNDAFLKVLLPNATVFTPAPVNGPAYYAKRPSVDGNLTWTPIFAEISHDGYLGYTTGPFTRANKDSSYHGEYISIWKREPYGNEWKLFVHGGVFHGPSNAVTAQAFSRTSVIKYPNVIPGLIKQSEDLLLSSDILLGAMLKTRTTEKTYREFMSPEARICMDGEFPIKGRDAIIGYFNHKNRSYQFSAVSSYVSVSRDMGFTLGTGSYVDGKDSEPIQKIYYLRVWKKGGDALWRVVLEFQFKKPD